MNIPFFSKKNKKEYYLGIFLKEEQGILMIFSKETFGLELIDREKFTYTNGWENLTDDVDEALYRLEKNLDIEIKKTIFFVYSHLVDEKIGDIKPVYLQKVKQLVKALELQAMGYVECFEAISFYLEKKEQISLSSILIEIDKTQLGIFVYKGGKIDSKKILGRTDDIIGDLSEGLEEIKKKTILPARIILYDSGNLDETATKILSHRWSSNLFVQIPKVDILSEDEVIHGLMGIFGEQLKDKTAPEKRETFGFVLNEDVKEKVAVEERKFLPTNHWNERLKSFFDKLKTVFPKKNPINFKMNFSGKLFSVIGTVIIILSFFINEYFFHKADLTVYLPTQVLEKNSKIEIDYRVSSASADFSQTINTSGKREVGDKARGSVTIHNFEDKEKTFAKGSIFETSGLKFLLDSDVKVASSSLAADGSAKLPGKNNGSVTAAVIGPESNLTKGQRFTIESLPATTYFAINDTAFTGGNKKQIQTVAKKDQEDLKEIILNKAKKEISSIKVLSGEIVASSLSRVDFSKTNFSKEIGEESSKLSLRATVAATHFIYDKNNFVDKALVLMKPEVKKQYQLEKENIFFTTNKVEKKDKVLIVDAKIKAKAVVKISPEKIKKTVLGKNKSELTEILKNRFKIDGYDVTIREPLSLLKNYLPFFSNNINLKNSSL
ncbi:MAG: hypothetical protein AAB437_00715 [Patescibacteria group bacterium]